VQCQHTKRSGTIPSKSKFFGFFGRTTDIGVKFHITPKGRVSSWYKGKSSSDEYCEDDCVENPRHFLDYSISNTLQEDEEEEYFVHEKKNDKSTIPLHAMHVINQTARSLTSVCLSNSKRF